MPKVIIARHGQSTYNKQVKFSGWTDVPLTPLGRKQAKQTGLAIKNLGIEFDYGYTSYLQRAIETLWISLKQMNRFNLEYKPAWQLNERHYGALQGVFHSHVKENQGEKQLFLWRRGFSDLPPILQENDPRNPKFDSKYSHLSPQDLPLVENLSTAYTRVIKYWKSEIIPKIKQDQNILIVCHGNTMRCIQKQVLNISDEDIKFIEFPLGSIIEYEFDTEAKLISHRVIHI